MSGTGEHCDQCGGRFDRPGLFGCGEERHPVCDFAQTIVAIIEDDLTDRRGCGWDDIDEDTQQDIRDVWSELIRDEVRRWKICAADVERLTGSATGE